MVLQKDWCTDMELEDLWNELTNEIQTEEFEARVCIGCGRTRSSEYFRLQELNSTCYVTKIRLRRKKCSGCQNEAAARRRIENPELVKQEYRAYGYKQRYGLDMDLANALATPGVRVQACPICYKTSNLVLDHDHNTGKNRDLICSHCNRMLGYALESIDTLYNAIAYLKKHKGV